MKPYVAIFTLLLAASSSAKERDVPLSMCEVLAKPLDFDGKELTVSGWMSLAGLGFSSMARRYAIHSREEAESYLSHRILGVRLAACAEALLAVDGRSAKQIMGDPDYMKLQSSMTLFLEIPERGSVFERVLAKYYGGAKDPKTTEFLRSDKRRQAQPGATANADDAQRT